MSVKSFKFVSPGVFIHEIDNSFIPKTPENIGPVVIGRSTRGLAMTPVQVEAYSDFVTMFGDTVPGGTSNGDIYRDGNYQSPMYGTYAAKAFMRANVAPLNYVRLLGQQSADNDGTIDSQAGWRTTQVNVTEVPATNGGAYALWLFTSGSDTATDLGTGSLAGVWYVDQGEIYLSGTVYGGSVVTHEGAETSVTGANNVLIGTDGDNLFTMVVSGAYGSQKIRFGFDDSSDTFVRKRFSTNPQLISGSTFYSSTTQLTSKDYWLGETYEQELRDRGLTTASIGVLMAIQNSTTSPSNMKNQASREARTGWFIGQDLGTAVNYVPFRQQKLFRLIGRGHGEWLQKNCKISIERVRQSTTTTTDYGTFSVVIRQLSDTDNAVVVLERFDNCTLDPASPDFVARKIGDQYVEWDATERRLRTYGEYVNQSKFVYVDMNSDVEAGATDATLLPFGYFGPPRYRAAYNLSTTGAVSDVPNTDGFTGDSLSAFYVTGGAAVVAAGGYSAGAANTDLYLSGGIDFAGGVGEGLATGSLVFPVVRLRTSASEGGLSNVTNAYFGMSTTRTADSTTNDPSIADFHRLLYAGYAGGGGTNPIDVFTTTGVEDYAYVFSLDNIVLKSGTTSGWYYSSGSRTREDSYTSASYEQLLDASINRFTAPLWGGFDGLDIMKPDPFYNNGMTNGTETNSYIYYTWRRAIDTVADPEYINMNLLGAPGLTNDNLTAHMINVCEERADSMALIDLANVYIPAHEQYYANKADRIGSPSAASTALKDRRIDSSYGATFYPWVQTRDENTGQPLWVPPSVALMGVLASSEAKSDVWFAPAGFNRGGLSEGAAGIPVTNVTERLTSKERDNLYDSRINPIASFPSTGIVVFGQKTLQERQSALDRINVRRLVIYLKKQISILSTQVLFEQNVQATWNRFKSLIEPFLANVKTRFGITDYRLILDSSTTTPDLIDQNIMYAKIMIKPARAIEFIAIDFVIASTGASFDD